MDFATLPPEINSVLMYTGSGSGPILAAATAWDAMAAELGSAAASYRSVISGLTGQWHGPASTAMAAAAAPYAAWMNATATRCEQAGVQARAAATAYETAFTMTVPPPVIATNRAQLAMLVATNFLGQNTPAIAATEAHYGEMWAQDATAMYGYAGGAAAATALSPLTPPKPNTNPAGSLGQSATVLQGTSTGTATKAQTALSQLTGTLQQTLQGRSQPLQSTPSTAGLGSMAMGTGTTAASSAASGPMGAMSALSAMPGAKGAAKGAGMGAAAAGPLGGFVGNEALGLVEDTAGLGMDGVGLVGLDGGGVGLDLIGVGLDFLGADTLTETGGGWVRWARSARWAASRRWALSTVPEPQAPSAPWETWAAVRALPGLRRVWRRRLRSAHCRYRRAGRRALRQR